MWLRTLAGAYAGQIRDYSIVAGLAALRTGMAARVVEPQAPVIGIDLASQPDRTAAVAVTVPSGKRKKK